MREVPLDVAMSMEWARASTLLRVVYAEVRPRTRERVGVVAADESPADLLGRVAAAVRVPLRASDAAEVLAEGERVGLWAVRERLVDGARWRFLVVAALPPSVVRARRDAEEAERGARGGKSDRQRQREHREATRGPVPLAALPGTEVPPGWSEAAGGEGSEAAPVDPPAAPPPGGDGGQVSGSNVTAQSREISPLSRDEAPRGTGGPPSLSGDPSGSPREGGGGPAPVAPIPPAAVAADGAAVLSALTGPVADADGWAKAAAAAAGGDRDARRAALEALGAAAVAALGEGVGPEVFNGRTAMGRELRGFGAVLVREGATWESLGDVRAWLRDEPAARKAFAWDAPVRTLAAPVTVALLVGKREEGEHSGSGWRTAVKGAQAWARKRAAVKAAPAPTAKPAAPVAAPGPVRAGPEPFASLEELKARIRGDG